MRHHDVRHRLVSTLLVAGVAAAALPAAATPVASGFEETAAVSGLVAPVAVAFLPDGRMLVAELGGGLHVVSNGSATLLATIPVASTCDFLEFETGLLGIAVDPSFATNGFIYLYRTNDHGNFFCNYPPDGWTNEVIRVTMGPGDTIDLDSLTVILPDIRVVWGYHNGGCLRIGPDQKLYVAVGDTYDGDDETSGPGTSTNIYAQDLNALEGKVLRLNLDGSIPPDNPYHGQAGKRGEIWASGFRNPFRFGFDPATERLWLGDVGQDDVEELDIVSSGGDYSWPHCEGSLPNGCMQAGETAPIYTYRHTADPEEDRSVTAGGFAGGLFGSLSGDYFFADYEKSEIYRLEPNAGRTGVTGSAQVFVTDAAGPVDVVFGPDGALYYAAIVAGEVRRVAPESGGEQPLFGQKLLLKGDPSKGLQAQAKDLVTIGLSGEDDPTLAGGTLRVAGAGFDDTYDLPASGWAIIGKPGAIKGFRYKDPAAANGPISLVQITNGKSIKITGKGAGLGHVVAAADPSPVDVVLTTGTRTYCMNFGGTVKFVANKKLSAVSAPAPDSCPAP